MQQILLATRNPGKAAELGAALADLSIELVTLAGLERSEPDPEETGETFAENAHIKATYWHALTGMPTLADDGGLLVDALPGELGVRTRRWAEKLGHTTDESWLGYFMSRMADVPTDERGAEFRIALCYIAADGSAHIFEGATRGSITPGVAAPIIPGIPVSSVFLADGANTVFAAMTKEEKNIWSHRGKAVARLKEFLTQ